MPTNEHLTDRPCRFQSLSEPNSKPYFIPNNNPKEDSDGHSVEKVALVDLEMDQLAHIGVNEAMCRHCLCNNV